MDRRRFLETLGTAATTTAVFPSLESALARARAANATSSDFVFIPGAEASPWEKDAFQYFTRRPGTTILRSDPRTLEKFMKDLGESSAVARPVRDLFVVAHAAPEGRIGLRLDSNHPRSLRQDQVGFFDVQDMVKSNSTSIRVPSNAVVRTGGARAARVRFVGCELGRAQPVVTRLGILLGSDVTLRVPRFSDVFVAAGTDGIVECFAYEFVVTRLSPLTSRAKVISAFKEDVQRADTTLRLFNGAKVEDAKWSEWIPPLPRNSIEVSEPIPVDHFRKLSHTLTASNGLDEITEMTVTMPKGYWHFIETFGFDSYAGATTEDVSAKTKRTAFMKRMLSSKPEFAETGCPDCFPVHRQFGFDTLDQFMASFDWWPQGYGPWTERVIASIPKDQKELLQEAEKMRVKDLTFWQGYRSAYVVNVPVTNAQDQLLFNFVPAPGSAFPVFEGLEDLGSEFFISTVAP